MTTEHELTPLQAELAVLAITEKQRMEAEAQRQWTRRAMILARELGVPEGATIDFVTKDDKVFLKVKDPTQGELLP